MGEHVHEGTPEKGVDGPPASVSPPANQDTMVEKLPSHRDAEIQSRSSMERAREKPADKSNDEPEYPSIKRVIPIVAALYMAFFLVALVSPPQPPNSTNRTNLAVGPHNHCNGHPSNNRRLPLPWRRWLVRLCLHADWLLLPTPHRPYLHLLQSQNGLSRLYRPLRNRLGHLRLRALLHRFHRWPRNRWLRLLWYFLRRHCHHNEPRAITQATFAARNGRGYIRHRVGYGTSVGRSIHNKGVLEMVLLH